MSEQTGEHHPPRHAVAPSPQTASGHRTDWDGLIEANRRLADANARLIHLVRMFASEMRKPLDPKQRDIVATRLLRLAEEIGDLRSRVRADPSVIRALDPEQPPPRGGDGACGTPRRLNLWELDPFPYSETRGRAEPGDTAGQPARIAVGGLVIDSIRREVTIDGRCVDLTHREYAILLYLAERAGEAVARDTLFEAVWGYDADLSGKLLDVYIRRVRAKVEPGRGQPVYIRTVRGYGYKLVIPGNPDD